MLRDAVKELDNRRKLRGKDDLKELRKSVRLADCVLSLLLLDGRARGC
jgi:hypothetical protein